MTPRTIRVLCVEDHAFLVEGLRARFELERDFSLAGRLATADDLVPEAIRLKPDVVLLDIEMPGLDPFEAAEDLHRRAAEIKVAVLSAFVRDHYLSAAFKAGCWGYFSKGDRVEDILDGIRRIVAGEFVLSPRVAERCKPPQRAQLSQPRRGQPNGSQPHGGQATPEETSSRLESLTSREQEVLRLIGRGMSRAQIAETLHRSAKTVDGHRERIMRKLDIHTNPELIRYAIREGLAEA